MSKISFIKSEDRKYNIGRCLSLLKSEIIAGLRDAKRVVVLAYCPNEKINAAAVNFEAIGAVMKFIRPYTSAQITLAAGTETGDTLTAFKNFHYLTLQEEYDFTISDLNSDETCPIGLLDRKGRKIQAQISRTIADSDYLISIALPKTHSELVYTGVVGDSAIGAVSRSTTNVASAISSRLGIIKNDKAIVFQGNFYTHQNIKKLFSSLPVRLAVLDGYEIMEGEGPLQGDLSVGHFAIASSDVPAVDWLTCQILGINIDDVGYLKLIDDEDEVRSDYFVIGDTWQKYIKKIKMPSNFDKIKEWK